MKRNAQSVAEYGVIAVVVIALAVIALIPFQKNLSVVYKNTTKMVAVVNQYVAGLWSDFASEYGMNQDPDLTTPTEINTTP